MNILSILAIIIVVLILITYLLKLILEHFTKGKYSIRIFLFIVGIMFLFLYNMLNSMYTGPHQIELLDIISLVIIVIVFKTSIYRKEISNS